MRGILVFGFRCFFLDLLSERVELTFFLGFDWLAWAVLCRVGTSTSRDRCFP
jgi:hypothetical protein